MPHGTPSLVVPNAGGASRDRTGDLLVANQTLSQLSYGPVPEPSEHRAPRSRPPEMVGLGGVEPPTSPLSGVRSNQLSYRPAGSASGCPEADTYEFLGQVICDGDSHPTTSVRSL